MELTTAAERERDVKATVVRCDVINKDILRNAIKHTRRFHHQIKGAQHHHNRHQIFPDDDKDGYIEREGEKTINIGGL